MPKWENIVLIVVPLIFGTYLSTLTLSFEQKIIVWIICLLICCFGIYREVKQGRKEDS